MRQLDILVKNIDAASTLPTVVSSVLKVCDHPMSNARSVGDAIAKDPVLTAKVLRTANSAFFGLASKCQNIQAAVVRIGIKSIRNLVLSLSVSSFFEAAADSDGYSRPNMWRHSIAVGIYNELLCGVVKMAEARAMVDEALLVGLVHDIGIILEDQYKARSFKPLPALAWQLKSHLHQVEKESFGFDHQDLGDAVLKKWKFPETLHRAVGCHHKPVKAGKDPLALLTCLSEMLAVGSRVGYADLRYVNKEQFSMVVKALGLDSRGLKSVQAEFGPRFQQACEMLGVREQPAKQAAAGFVLRDEDVEKVPQ